MNAFFVIYHKVVEHIGLEPITFRLPVCLFIHCNLLFISCICLLIFLFCET